MIQDRIAQIEATLQNASDLPTARREELLALLNDLKTEIAVLAPAHDEQAQRVTRSADAAFSLAAQPEESTAPVVLKELRESVEGFEASHPRLVQIVDRIALTLSNMGI